MRYTTTTLFLASALLASCAGFEDDDEGQVAETEIPFDRRGTIPARRGYLDKRKVDYYKLGNFVPADASWFPRYEAKKFPGLPVRDLYVFVDGAGELAVEPQYPIIDSLPLQARSSDFLELVKVSAPSSYRANAVKSVATLQRAEYALERTGKIVNCPIVSEQAALGTTRGTPSYTPKKLRLWYRGKAVHCLLLEGGAALGVKGAPPVLTTVTPTGARHEHRVTPGELFALRSRAFSGADQVTNIAVPDNDVFRHGPAAPGYSPLVKVYDVTVPSDYTVGQLGSYAELYPVPDFTDPRIEERNPEAFCNCPVVRVDP